MYSYALFRAQSSYSSFELRLLSILFSVPIGMSLLGCGTTRPFFAVFS